MTLVARRAISGFGGPGAHGAQRHRAERGAPAGSPPKSTARRSSSRSTTASPSRTWCASRSSSAISESGRRALSRVASASGVVGAVWRRARTVRQRGGAAGLLNMGSGAMRLSRIGVAGRLAPAAGLARGHMGIDGLRRPRTAVAAGSATWATSRGVRVARRRRVARIDANGTPPGLAASPPAEPGASLLTGGNRSPCGAEETEVLSDRGPEYTRTTNVRT